MQANLWHKLSHFYYFLLNQESVESKGKITEVWISQKQKELLKWNKKAVLVKKIKQ